MAIKIMVNVMKKSSNNNMECNLHKNRFITTTTQKQISAFVQLFVLNYQSILSFLFLQDLAKPLMTYFRDEGHFDSQPWTIYFHLGVAFMGQPVLQLEKYSCCKRQRILDHYGDMRHLMACQILSLWAHLGPIKLHFIPGNISFIFYVIYPILTENL